MNLGERVRVQLSFPGFLEPVTIAGQVAWSRAGSGWEEPGFGLQADTGIEHLARLVSSWRETDENPLDPSIHVLVVQSEIEPGAAAGRVLLERAGSRQEAIGRARAKPPSLIITDLFFPESDCLRMIKDLSEEPGRPILVANSNNPDDTARAQALGTYVLPRTVRFAHLFRTVLTLRSARGLGGVVAA
jgi:CheY-like chemotaxis protein